MTELVTSARMRAIEAAAIASGAVTGLDLMERAGVGVVEAIFQEWPEMARAPHRVVVLCGPGNNGGDGFVVARLLHAVGWSVELFLFGAGAPLPRDAQQNRARWEVLGSVTDGGTFAPGSLDAVHLVVDAIFGTGLSRLVTDPAIVRACEILSDMAGPKVVALDVPSGLCADSGRRLGASVRAHLTVTFHAAKPGHYLADGPDACGKLLLKDIGLSSWSEILPPEAPGASAARIRLVDAPTASLAKPAGAHKYSHGHALILSGGAGKGGAARLAARGALRVGAGLVTIACPPAALAENAARLDAILLLALADSYSLRGVLQDARLNALLLGPGLGLARAQEMVPAALSVKRPTVLDADALTAFAETPEQLFAILHPACVLTPHEGEFARLFPDIAARLTSPARSGPACSKVDAARAAAERARCVVLFKGPDTVIAAPDGQCAIHAASYDRSAPWLATAGSGDVLAGIIVGLLARGFAPMQAAETAAWLHVDCACRFGPGLIAEDLPEELPAVLGALALQAAAVAMPTAPQPIST
ncbi:MAG: NAD(P)H-hydrate dehydratase, partial [Pseudorhodobacter sp.]|nr:NAD(P)H-hydrate dehydratase [Pseudorhodobacter sp.]